MSMLLHCGSVGIDRSELATLPVPPAKGKRHFIKPFIDTVNEISEALSTNGITIADESFGVKTKDDMPAQMFGLMHLKFPEIISDDYALTYGFRGAYDQSFKWMNALGSNVFVCDNLCFSGEIQFGTKQTLNMNGRVAELLSSAVAQIPELAFKQDNRFRRYKEVEVGKHGVDSAIIDLVRVGTILPSQVGKVIEEWDVPKHVEHASHGHSVWRFHNAVTEAIKPANEDRPHVVTAMARTLPLTTMCDKLAA